MANILVNKKDLIYKNGHIFNKNQEVFLDDDVAVQLNNFECCYQKGKVLKHNEDIKFPKLKEFNFESEHKVAIKLEKPKTPTKDKFEKDFAKQCNETHALDEYEISSEVLDVCFRDLAEFITNDEVIVYDNRPTVYPSKLDLKYTGNPFKLDEKKFKEMLPYVAKGATIPERMITKKVQDNNDTDGDSLIAD